MPNLAQNSVQALMDQLAPEQPVLIAGPTASGKSALALAIAQEQGGVIVNADASQVYECWQVITARPSLAEMAGVPHALYGHVASRDAYSAGHWLREVKPFLSGNRRPIIVGGTGLYFSALTKGLAEIPPTPDDIRQLGDALPLEAMLADLDAETTARIDCANPARVQRAWEVLRTTGRGLADWQDDTGAPLLPLSAAFGIVFDIEKPTLDARIAQRFDQMITSGALEEVAAVAPHYDATLPAHRAIGVPELMRHLRGEIDLPTAKEHAVIATRQYAKRQRTWMRSKMKEWAQYSPS